MALIMNFSEKSSQNWIKEAERVRHGNILDLKGVVWGRTEKGKGKKGKGEGEKEEREEGGKGGFVVFKLGKRETLRSWVEKAEKGELVVGKRETSSWVEKGREEGGESGTFTSGGSSIFSLGSYSGVAGSKEFSHDPSSSSSSSSSSSTSFETPFLFTPLNIFTIVNQCFDAITYLHNNLRITHNNITANNTFLAVSSPSSSPEVGLGMGQYERMEEGKKEGGAGDWLALGKLVGEMGGAGRWEEGEGEREWVEKVREEKVKELVKGLVVERWGEEELGERLKEWKEGRGEEREEQEWGLEALMKNLSLSENQGKV